VLNNYLFRAKIIILFYIVEQLNTSVMKTYIIPNKILTLSIICVVIISMVSCGSARYADYGDTDGIYGSSAERTTDGVVETDNRNYYKQYFQTKAKVYANEPEGDIIFTDVEGYTSTEAYIDENGVIYEEDIAYTESYGGWGENAQVSINVYSNPGFGYYGGYWNTPYWWYGSGWGLSHWNAGWGWGGFYGPGWGGFYGPGWGHPFYGGGWAYGGYSPYYGNWHNSNYAYNRGRRNTDMNNRSNINRSNVNARGRSSINNRANVDSNRSRTYSRSEVERRINNSRSSQNARENSATSRNNRFYQQQRTNPNVRGTPNRTTPNQNMSRPNSSRNSSPTINRGGSSVRSSGSTSSGTRSGGGTSRRGGGL